MNLLEISIKNKIIDFSDLKNCINPGEVVVQSHGVFDLLHIGHIKHFQAAKSHGDVLVVTVTPDRFVNKGPGRPRFTEKLRAEAIAALECVNFVIINRWPTAVEAIGMIKPAFYAKGDEYQNDGNDITGKISEEKESIQNVGGKVIFTHEPTFSSSSLLNEFYSPFLKEVTDYLNVFRRKYSFQDIYQYFEKAKTLKILLVGETIIDDYRFTDVIGKAGKEPTLVAKYKYREIYLGGILAIANHLSDFCKEVNCLTYLGENAEYNDVINNNLKKNVTVTPIYKKNSPTIVKRRYLDEYLKQKLFEEYEISDDFLENDQRDEFMGHLDRLLKDYDLVITADYGHGLLDDKSIGYLTKNAKFLAVNTQANAGNNGFNFISKYDRADYVVIASRELQLNFRQKHLSLHEQMKRLMQEHDYQCAMVTSGKSGADICKKGETIVNVPAFTTNIVDRIGAGDAVLSISSLFAYQNSPSDLIAFIGNIAGTQAVNIMGNKNAIARVGFLKNIQHLLK
ncbi:MAG: hypothetical protein A3F11_11560 [Gammaproteobacteria bacterium RIFCSPHIGHO2_12_FULL_37_14]|nr:MAG: hypothetical protein A3F11_11560 [Gammaproteobacteria bacterium RIFCSPHIGHO2_12_FULL_37_14]